MNLSELEREFIEYIQRGALADGSHDIGHFRRVWRMSQRLQEMESGKANDHAGKANDHADEAGVPADLEVLLAAAYFHDLISLPKNHPDRKKSSVLSAQKAGEILAHVFPQFPPDKIPAVQHAIEAHSFSAGIPALTLEAKILQDADRMEALGAIGIARTFYTAGFMHSRMFHETDPLGLDRPLDDTRFALDHFVLKLLKLPSMMQTGSGRKIAEQRAATLSAFRALIAQEIEGQ
jgi:uncharacterized protein